MFKNIKRDYVVHGRVWMHRPLWALIVYRFGVWSLHRKWAVNRFITSKMYGLLNLFVEILTGIHMDRHLKVGKDFNIMHAGQIFIAPSAVIGDRCGIMQNVTIGTMMDREGVPEIGDDVFIGAGACVLGGIKVGNRARIGANSVVTKDVPEGAVVFGVPARIYRDFHAGQGKAAPDAAPKEAEPTTQADSEKTRPAEKPAPAETSEESVQNSG